MPRPVARHEAAAGLMRKVRSNATWNGLSKENRAKLEGWLFEEGMGFNAALERARQELGFAGSRTSLRRFYERMKTERMLSGLTDAGRLAETVEKSEVSVERLRSAGMKLAAEMFLRTVASAPENPKAWLPLAKLLVQAEKNEAWYRVKQEENSIREHTLGFRIIKDQYHLLANALEALPELQAMAEAADNPEKTKFESNKRMNALRRKLFGDAIPEVQPENEEEAAHPEILRAREKAAYAKAMLKFAAEQEERERKYEEMKERAEANGRQNEEGAETERHEPSEEDKARWAREDANDGTEPLPGEEEDEGGYYPGSEKGGK